MEPFIGEIRALAFNFPPKGWALCNGQLLAIRTNTALFSLLGTTYGGDGRTTFALPNLAGQALMNAGQGPGLTNRNLGDRGGEPTVTLTDAQMPSHSHPIQATNRPGNDNDPNGQYFAAAGNLYSTTGTASATLAPQALQPFAGLGLPHENRMPYGVLNYCIALEGVFPQRP